MLRYKSSLIAASTLYLSMKVAVHMKKDSEFKDNEVNWDESLAEVVGYNEK
jgi:hypothetical protein